MRFRNRYVCPCGEEWSDEWSVTCDDRCPRCSTSCSPVESEDLPEEDGQEEWEPCGEPRPPVRIPEAAYDLFGQVLLSYEPISPETPVQVPQDTDYTQLDMFGGKDGR